MTEPTLTREQLARLRELREKATPGPWRYFDGGNPGRDSGLSEIDGPDIEDGVCFMMADGRRGEVKMRLNADLIVATHEALPSLLAGCERAMELEERLAQFKEIAEAHMNVVWLNGKPYNAGQVVHLSELDSLRARVAELERDVSDAQLVLDTDERPREPASILVGTAWGLKGLLKRTSERARGLEERIAELERENERLASIMRRAQLPIDHAANALSWQQQCEGMQELALEQGRRADALARECELLREFREAVQETWINNAAENLGAERPCPSAGARLVAAENALDALRAEREK